MSKTLSTVIAQHYGLISESDLVGLVDAVKVERGLVEAETERFNKLRAEKEHTESLHINFWNNAISGVDQTERAIGFFNFKNTRFYFDYTGITKSGGIYAAEERFGAYKDHIDPDDLSVNRWNIGVLASAELRFGNMTQLYDSMIMPKCGCGKRIQCAFCVKTDSLFDALRGESVVFRRCTPNPSNGLVKLFDDAFNSASTDWLFRFEPRQKSPDISYKSAVRFASTMNFAASLNQ